MYLLKITQVFVLVSEQFSMNFAQFFKWNILQQALFITAFRSPA